MFFSHSILNGYRHCSVILQFQRSFAISKERVYTVSELITNIDRIIDVRRCAGDFGIYFHRGFIYLSDFDNTVQLPIRKVLGIQSRISRISVDLSKHFDVLPDDCVEKPRPCVVETNKSSVMSESCRRDECPIPIGKIFIKRPVVK